jgi:biopolymer transport protein ExbD
MPVQLHSQSGDEGDEARIEIIPLIDIMFFLLAAFMLVSLSMTHLRRVPVELPAASTAIPDSVTPPFQITIDANGVTTRDGQIITLSEITTQLRSAAPPGVLIAADENSLHKNVLAVINAIREAGVETISFETKR